MFYRFCNIGYWNIAINHIGITLDMSSCPLIRSIPVCHSVYNRHNVSHVLLYIVSIKIARSHVWTNRFLIVRPPNLTTSLSGRNKGQKFVGHFFEDRTFCRLLIAIPLKMYSKIGWILVGQMLKLFIKWPMTNCYFYHCFLYALTIMFLKLPITTECTNIPCTRCHACIEWEHFII